MSKFHPQIGDLTETPEPVKPKVHYGAVLNLPEPGTFVRANLQGWEIEGKVRFSHGEYGAFTVEKKIWINNHYRGTASVRVDVKLGWNIEILDEPPAGSKSW